MPARAVLRLGVSFALLSAAGIADAQTLVVPKEGSPGHIENFKAFTASVSQSRHVSVTASQEESGADVSARALTVTLSSLPGVPSVTGLAIPAIELNELEADLTQRLALRSNATPSFLTGLQRRFRSVTLPAVRLNWFDTANSDWIHYLDSTPATAEDLVANRTLAASLLRARAAGFEVRMTDLQVLLDQAPTGSPGPISTFSLQYNRTLDSLAAAIQDPVAANTDAFAANARLTRDRFIEAWPRLRNDAPARSEAVRRLAGLLEQSALKAIYNVSSNFPPPSYEDIFRQSQRVVGLVMAGETRCSGILFTDDWVLTAGHCLSHVDFDSVQVSIDVVGASARSGVDDQWPRTGHGGAESDGMDYAFLHLARDDGFTAAVQRLATAPRLCARSRPADYKEPVIVIARRSDDPIKVYDHAYVWFPFRVGPNIFAELSAETGARLQRLAEAWFPDQPSQVDFFERNMRDFEHSYRLAADGRTREYRAERHGLAERPYFGMDTDTFHGNSGAPVFSRMDICMIGVFEGGALDNAVISEGTWKEHEFAVPLSEIVADLRRIDPAADNPGAALVEARQALLRALSPP